MALKFQPNKNERIFAIGYSNICSSCSKRWKPCSVSCQMSVLIHTNLSNVTVAIMPIHFGKKNEHHPFLRAPNFRRSTSSFFSPRFFPQILAPACQKHSSSAAKPHGVQRRAVHLNENGKMQIFSHGFFLGQKKWWGCEMSW